MNVPLESPAPGPAPGPRPALGPIVSIVIVCPGQLEYTRHCVRSVLNHTSGPVELVFVDLASLDGTREFLRGFAVASPVPVRVFGLSAQSTFADALATGAKRSTGESLVFLNNDTIVTDGWLNHLTGLANYDPTIGMVGAMSNCAPPAQTTGSVPYHFRSAPTGPAWEQPVGTESEVPFDEIDAYARQWREEHLNQWFEPSSLGTFCLLVKREVLTRIGMSFAAGPLGVSDEDLSRRVLEAGYRLACCKDQFIHHFGTRSPHYTPFRS